MNGVCQVASEGRALQACTGPASLPSILQVLVYFTFVVRGGANYPHCSYSATEPPNELHQATPSEG